MSKRIRNIKCEESCCVCDSDAIYHHIKHFGAGGDSEIDNLLPLCTRHHNEIHSWGTNSFVTVHRLSKLMKSKGWDFCEIADKWVKYIHGNQGES